LIDQTACQTAAIMVVSGQIEVFPLTAHSLLFLPQPMMAC